MDDQNQKLIYLVTELGYFCSHRLTLALAAKHAGYQVTVVTNCEQRANLSQFEDQLKEFNLYHLPFHRSRLNPLSELKTLWQLAKAYRHLRPHIVHQVALKPALYGTFCARLTGVSRIVNAFGGMGYLFTHKSIKSTVIKPIMALAFRLLLNSRRCMLILQNPDDVDLMTPFLGRDKIKLIRGAGVNLKKFYPTEEPTTPPVKVLMVSRLLWSKGIGELVEAASILKKEGIPIEISIAGDPDIQNPASISESVLEAWKHENIVNWLGTRTDIANLYHQAHIAVLPSYREGLPKSLLEAAACGKPIVTTNVPGCREVVVAGENGLLVPPRNALALANALKKLTEYPDLRIRMGKLSRRKAEQEFDEEKIIAQTLAVYGEE
jgi:glycosyltransferase involved in cell wall biosynthesis